MLDYYPSDIKDEFLRCFMSEILQENQNLYSFTKFKGGFCE